ncbi:N-acetylmuramoyl-L-alanine amidase [Arvimicrobium flavum]|uniref:N-acetylmuramoyl-L-alanine amidase n=1 Tax=Arvimicrobium flavum TaxID=3393320 RepID=UPI00237A48F2|nr:N-acetylmuramoyl-L-alanine amidase [Mesorhizobium shangrilense]
MSGFLADQPGAEVRVSPNFGQRRESIRTDMIILHYTGMKSGAAAESWLCDPASEVSSHYLVHEDGRIVQMVRESDRAWHAGKSSWRGVTDINSCSVGVEIVNPGHEFGYVDFPDDQIAAVIGLCKGISQRHGVPCERVLAHSDVAPGRKVDPGERFPWEKLFRSGLGHFVAPEPVGGEPRLALGDQGQAVENLQSMLALYGYGIEITGVYESATRTVVNAFQRHFRPGRIDGIADGSTSLTLRKLLEALPEPIG